MQTTFKSSLFIKIITQCMNMREKATNKKSKIYFHLSIMVEKHQKN